jgi:hypothetical protein
MEVIATKPPKGEMSVDEANQQVSKISLQHNDLPRNLGQETGQLIRSESILVLIYINYLLGPRLYSRRD